MNLAGNHLGYNGLKHLLDNYDSISKIELLSFDGYCSNDESITYDNIGKNGSLYLTEKLSMLRNLRTLNIAYNSLDNEVMESLGSNFSYITSLEHLELCCNYIGEEGIAKFVKHVGQKKKNILNRFFHCI